MSESFNRVAKYRRGDLVETICVSGEARIVETYVSYKITYPDGTSMVHTEEVLRPYTKFKVDSFVLHRGALSPIWQIEAIDYDRGEAWIRSQTNKEASRVAKLADLTLHNMRLEEGL